MMNWVHALLKDTRKNAKGDEMQRVSTWCAYGRAIEIENWGKCRDGFENTESIEIGKWFYLETE